MKDHELAKLTNDLRDIAIKYGQTQQLRERIAYRLHPEINRLREEHDNIQKELDAMNANYQALMKEHRKLKSELK